MKNFFLNRVVLAIFAFIVGGVSVWGVMRHGENKKLSSKEEAAPSQFSFRNDPDRFFNSFFNDDLFG
jgi:hypothetical protein